MASELTDEHIALLEAALDKIENEYTPTCESVGYGSGCPGATDASRDFWRRAVDCLPALLTEIRARRAREKALVDEVERMRPVYEASLALKRAERAWLADKSDHASVQKYGIDALDEALAAAVDAALSADKEPTNG